MFGNLASNPNPAPATGSSTFGMPLYPSLNFFFSPAFHQEHLEAVTATRLVTQSPPLGLAPLEVEGHLPLAQVAEHSARRLHLNQLRQTQACSAKQIPLGARLDLVHLITSLQQARLDQRVVCPWSNLLKFTP